MSQDHESIVDKLQFWPTKRLSMILQSEAAECGLACLAMVADYHGHQTDLVSMRRRFNLSLGGATLMDIMQFAQTLNLTSRPLRIELSDLQLLQAPSILHWDLNHFVVLKHADENSIVIHDPATGERKLDMAEVSNHFTGVALELTPTSEFKKVNEKSTLKFSDFWSKITGLKKSLLLVFTLSVLLQVFVLANPYYMQLVIDDVVLQGDASLLSVLAIGFAMVMLFEVGTNALRGFTLLHFGNLMNLQLGANLYHHLLRLPMDFFEKRHIGDIVSRFGSLQQVRQLLTTGITETVIDGIMALVTLAMIFFYSPVLSLVVLLTVILYGLVRYLTYLPLRQVTEQEIAASAEENSNFMESVRAMQTIKLFGAEVKREGEWQNLYAKSINQGIRVGNLNIAFETVNKLLFGFENIIVVYLAAKLVMAGGFSTGMLFAFMAYKRQFITKMANLIEKLIEFKMLGLHFERLADIALTEKESSSNTFVRSDKIKGKITLKNLSFSYSDATPNIIENLNLEIKAGESVAITGPSGCGKSTLMKLMLGLNEANKGEVLIDDIPIAELGHKQYRSQIAAVMQNDELLSGSIAENISFSDSKIDMERVVYCAQLASIHDDISNMPMGYDSLIGDMGSSLSGGQKQRVILARALYKKPAILFMDEATSNLDTRLEGDINEAVSRLSITRVIIAHRTETIKSADREVNLASVVNKTNEYVR